MSDVTWPLFIGEDSRHLAAWGTQVEKRLDILTQKIGIAPRGNILEGGDWCLIAAISPPDYCVRYDTCSKMGILANTLLP